MRWSFRPNGQVRASNELRKRGVFASPSGVRCVWLRHDLATFKRRLAALERKAAQTGMVLIRYRASRGRACHVLSMTASVVPRLVQYR